MYRLTFIALLLISMSCHDSSPTTPALAGPEKAKKKKVRHTHKSKSWGDYRKEAFRAKFLTGEEAVKKMTAVDGLETKLYASEPMITQPNAFCWDDRGRLWIAENRDYEGRGMGFSKYGNSRILILEDTNGDGKADTRKVFVEGIPFPSALAVGFDGLFLGAVPNLLFVPDKNGDDKADSEIEVRLTGWGIRDRHEVLNSLSWGPDGWLYGCQGFATPSRVGKPKGKGQLFKKGDGFPTNIKAIDPIYIDGGVWRYHPTKDVFEVVAHGFSNPWGIDWNDNGQLFTAVCVIPHLWHVIQGGIYHRQGGRHINPYVYEDIKTIGDHRHASAHGGIRIYLADLLPKKYRDRVVMANIHQHEVLTDILKPKGSGFVGLHGNEMMAANDKQWVGFSVETGPEGAVYILDWHDADICGGRVRTKDTGRIYRIAPKGAKGPVNFDLKKLSDSALVKLQANRNDWWVRRARLILQQRAHEGKLSETVHADLWKMFKEQKELGRKLRAMWALHVTKALSEKDLLAMLSHPEEYIRSWAINFLVEDKNPSEVSIRRFMAMSKEDKSPVVRRHLAGALQRMPSQWVLWVAEGLVSHGEDQNDHNIPKMIWYGIEPIVAKNPDEGLKLAFSSKIPLVSNFIIRRIMDAKKYEATLRMLLNMKDKKALLNLMAAVTSSKRPQIASSAIPNLANFEERFFKHSDLQIRAAGLKVCQFFGSKKANEQLLVKLKDPKTSVKQRSVIIKSLASFQYKGAVKDLIKFLDDKYLRVDTLRALSSFNDGHIPGEILKRYMKFNKEEKGIALDTLSSRTNSAKQLWQALRGKYGKVKILKPEVPAHVVRKLTRVLGPAFKDYWGKSMNAEKAINKYKKLLTDKYMAKADLKKGKALFTTSCAVCHVLYGKGGKIGPELTGSNRADLSYILLNIINPNEEIVPAYQLLTINKRDGQLISGILKSKSKTQIVISVVGQDVTILKSDIQSQSKSKISMMPEGLLNNLKDEQVRDLIGYLRTKKDIK